MAPNPFDPATSTDLLLRRRMNPGRLIALMAVVIWAWNLYRVFG